MRNAVLCLVACLSAATCLRAAPAEVPARVKAPRGVCPPFHLRAESGEVIDPVRGLNADRPYSPRFTCGVCHDYARITKGYHFTAGAGEAPTATQRRRVGWASTPGFYGGNWCSPSPLYGYLSPVTNHDAAAMDLTSYGLLGSCGGCHPGGGPAERDRGGLRYDDRAGDPAAGFVDGGANGLHGDYHEASWTASGVMEADCLLCHLPGYDHEGRKAQVSGYNFRWAATVGARLARVEGRVGDGAVPAVSYHRELFDAKGRPRLSMVRSPRNEACLSCHEQPGWKKRGTNYRPRTDVHLRAGLRCVDCHPAGEAATDPRIAGRERHDIGKGNDPGGLVRDDLDDTMRRCRDCHDGGAFGAPVPRHPGLAPLHLDRVACQSCHVPERLVKPVSFVASDVFNAAPRIPGGGKQLWTFYGPDGAWRNHYGYLDMMGYDDKPTEAFRPTLVRYGGQIRPANRVGSSWPGIEEEGREALLQPRMRDVRGMWVAHREDASRYPSLSRIGDDNGDGVVEVNRPDEIDALIEAVRQRMDDVAFPMGGRRVVWVYNDRVYRSGSEFRTVPKEVWEASPWGNVHTYNHDVSPARAALGSTGCTDCHRPGAHFFFGPVVTYPFDGEGRPVVVPQWTLLEIGETWALLGAWREFYGKPVLYGLLCVLLVAGFVALAARLVGVSGMTAGRPWVSWLPWGAGGAGLVALARVLADGALREYMLPTRAWLDGNHAVVGVGVMALGCVALLLGGGRNASTAVVVAGLTAAGASGLGMLGGLDLLGGLARASYTLYDAGLILVTLGVGGLILGAPRR